MADLVLAPADTAADAVGTAGTAGGEPPGEAVQRTLAWGFLGRRGYREGVELQAAARQAVREGGGEQLLLLEHPHVYTLGRNADGGDVLADAAWLAARGVEVVESDRGGQVTYHGPGQLVGYPILNLSPDRRDIRRYVGDLEAVLIRTLADYGIAAAVRPGSALVGVWVGEEKIAAIGVHLSRWITTHGFALNVATDLGYYAGIVPCGLRGGGITSMARLLGAAPPLGEVAARLAGHFAAVFGRRLAAMPGAAAEVGTAAPGPVGVPAAAGIAAPGAAVG